MYKEKDRQIKSLLNLLKQKDAIIINQQKTVIGQQKTIIKLMEAQQLTIQFKAN